MDFARLLAELADLKEKLASLEGENTALKAERDRLAASLHDIMPPMTELDLADMHRNVGTLDDVIRELEAEMGKGGNDQ